MRARTHSFSLVAAFSSHALSSLIVSRQARPIDATYHRGARPAITGA
jgi:hypothetical protein